jgi:hypothetical protein
LGFAVDVPQQLEIFAEVLGRSYEVNFGNKGDHIQAMRAIASTQTTMHLSDIDSLGSLFEGMDKNRWFPFPLMDRRASID